MPYSITTRDGITINNIPDDVDPNSPELKARVAQIRAGREAAPEEPTDLGAIEVRGGQQPAPEPTTDIATQMAAGTPAETTPGGIAGAITRGLAVPAAGAALGAIAGAPIGGVGAVPGAVAGAGAATIAQMVADPIVSSVNNLLGTKYTLPTDALRDLLTRIGVPDPDTEAEKIIQTTAMGAGGAGGMAAAGRALQTAAAPGVTREVGRVLAAQPGVQITAGGGGGAAAQLAQEMGAGPVGQIAASLVGGLGTGAVASRLGAPRVAPGPRPPVLEEAEQAGVRVMTSDVMPPQTFMQQTLQAAGERVPFIGTGGVREAQQAQRIDAVRTVLRDFGAEDVAKLSDDVMRDLATKRSSDIQKYSTSKNEVVNRLANRGVVPVTNATKAIDDQINNLARRRTEGADEAIERLQEIKTNLQDRDLFQLEAYRKDELAKIFMDDPARPMSLAAREAGEKALRAIYDPVRKDMQEFIKTVGDRRDLDKFMVANKRLAETARDMENASLKTVLMKGDVTPEVVQNLLFKGKPSEVRALYSKLTPKGRATAQAAILAKAAKDSIVDLGQEQLVSPDRFANQVKKMGSSVGVFFSGDDLKRIEGLTRVLNITKRAGQAGVAPPTGVQAVPFLAADVLSGTFGGPTGATAAAATVGGLARIYESPTVRDILLKLPKTASGSFEEATLAKRLLNTIQTQAESIQAAPQEMGEILQ
jgi:hypothetical protein